jgi:uncharacterized protein
MLIHCLSREYLLKKIACKTAFVLAVFILNCSILAAGNETAAQTQKKFAVKNTHLGGRLGQLIDLCIENSIKARNPLELVEPFKYKNEKVNWQSEFWGKWCLSAVDAYRYTKDASILKTIEKSVSALLETQTNDGYIGNYADSTRLDAWDIWGRKYTLVGLLSYYEISNDKKSLNAAKKLVDGLINELSRAKKSIVRTGNYRGMASSSILGGIVHLYELTKEKKYLQFAESIVKEWEIQDGPCLVSKALANINLAERFPHTVNWSGWENGEKAYEMMSCYEGLLELYKATGNSDYLKAVEMTVQNIIDTEITEAGSGSSLECWFGGKKNQVYPVYNPMETCVTVTWMKLCFGLLGVTGNPVYADQIEKSIYNALIASMEPDGSGFAKYVPLEGFRSMGENQCGMPINCCTANGPRGFMMVPDFALMCTSEGVKVNLFCPSEITFKTTDNNSVTLKEETNFPSADSVVIYVSAKNEASFPLAIRIPEWSDACSIAVNNSLVQDIKAGTYKTISRTWKNGDKIFIHFNIKDRIERIGHYFALKHGPILLARDSRFGDNYTGIPSKVLLTEGNLNITQDKIPQAGSLISFTASFYIGSNREDKERKNLKIHLCDFASSANSCKYPNHYQVWQTETIDIRKK